MEDQNHDTAEFSLAGRGADSATRSCCVMEREKPHAAAIRTYSYLWKERVTARSHRTCCVLIRVYQKEAALAEQIVLAALSAEQPKPRSKIQVEHSGWEHQDPRGPPCGAVAVAPLGNRCCCSAQTPCSGLRDGCGGGWTCVLYSQGDRNRKRRLQYALFQMHG